MGLKKVTGTKVELSSQRPIPQSVDPPEIIAQHTGQTTFKALALSLLGVTAIRTEEGIKAIQEAAAGISEVDNDAWTREDADTILSALGSVPVPSHVKYWSLKNEGTLLFQAASEATPGAKTLNYPKGSRAPRISLMGALRAEGITIPKGMKLRVPVKLMEDDQGLVLAAFLRKGTLQEAAGDEE